MTTVLHTLYDPISKSIIMNTIDSEDIVTIDLEKVMLARAITNCLQRAFPRVDDSFRFSASIDLLTGEAMIQVGSSSILKTLNLDPASFSDLKFDESTQITWCSRETDENQYSCKVKDLDVQYKVFEGYERSLITCSSTCATCSTSASTCTSCNANYYLQGITCKVCATGGYSDGGTVKACTGMVYIILDYKE